MTFQDKAKEFYNMIQEGKLLDAINKYYHEKVVVIDADGNTRENIDSNKKYDISFLNEIQEIYGGEILSVTSDEKRQITAVEYWIELKFKNGTKRKFEEISVQHWQNDKIIRERFYKCKCH